MANWGQRRSGAIDLLLRVAGWRGEPPTPEAYRIEAGEAIDALVTHAVETMAERLTEARGEQARSLWPDGVITLAPSASPPASPSGAELAAARERGRREHRLTQYRAAALDLTHEPVKDGDTYRNPTPRERAERAEQIAQAMLAAETRAPDVVVLPADARALRDELAARLDGESGERAVERMWVRLGLEAAVNGAAAPTDLLRRAAALLRAPAPGLTEAHRKLLTALRVAVVDDLGAPMDWLAALDAAIGEEPAS